MPTRSFSQVCAMFSLVLLLPASPASAEHTSSAASARESAPYTIGVAHHMRLGSTRAAIAAAQPLNVRETLRVLIQRPSAGTIIHVTNDSWFDGPVEGGGVIFLAANVIKTNRRAAHLAIAVTAVRKSGGKVGPLAEKSDNCLKATSCQVTSVEKGKGENYRVPGHFTGEIDAVAKGTWYRRGKAPLVATATEVYNFQDGLLQP